MTLTVDTFREMFPEFSDDSVFSDTLVSAKITQAERYVIADLWGDDYDYGVALVTAHLVVLSLKASNAVSAGSLPGESVGNKTSKSAGPLSVSYSLTDITEEGAGFWNLTLYGMTYIHDARNLGAAPRFFI